MFELLFKHSPWAYRAGEFAFASGWPLWLLGVLIGVGAVAIALSLGWRRNLSWPRALVIGTLQALLFAVALTLLWRPALQVERVRDRQNVVAIVTDASASMIYGEANRSRLQSAVATLQADVVPQLSKVFGLRLYSFAEQITPIERFQDMPPPGTQSRIGDALRGVLQTAASTPLAAIVLVSDGAENGGTLNEQRMAELAAFGIPIHTVGVGPEHNSNDLELEAVNLADEATPGEVLTAEVSIRHDRAAKTRLRVYDGTTLLVAREITLPAAAGVVTQTLEVPAGDAGVRDLRFELEPLAGEVNLINNRRSHVIDVSAARHSILYVEGEPRWEYKFIRRAAETDRSLRLAGLVRATPNRYYRQGVQSGQELVEGFPQQATELFAYDAVVIGSLEAPALNAEQHRLLKEFVDRRGGSLLMLAGRDGLSDGGWGRAPIADALPAHLSTSAGTTYVQRPGKAQLTIYGAESAIGHLDSDPRRNAALWKGLPDLADFQPLGRLKPGAVVLLETLGSEGRQPLLLSQRYGRGTTYLMGTASTWRWRMRLPHEDERHRTFWRQLLHAVAAGAPSRSTLTTERKVYDDERRVAVQAELRDEEFKPIDNAAVEVTAVDEQGESTVMPMQHSAQGEGRYVATVDANATGLYRFEMKARVGEKQLGSAATHVRRNEGVLEHFATYQHRALLERVAQATGGRYWQLDQLAELSEAIRYSKAGILERQTLELWNLPAVFLLLLALKSAEWLLRRRWQRL